VVATLAINLLYHSPKREGIKMNVRSMVTLYMILLIIISALYVFSASISTFSHAATPDIDRTISIFSDLIKVIVGAAIGSISAAFVK
jgi:hypothetical protein